MSTESLSSRGERINPPRSLPYPEGAREHRINWRYATAVGALHLVALLAFAPWFFSWTGLIACVIGIFLFGSIGINLCYHRLLAHRGFCCPKWLEYTFAIFGVCCLQDSPARWVAVHRKHHHRSDEEQDPHSPLVNFFWSYAGWLLIENRDLSRVSIFDRYARDLLTDRFYVFVERYSFLVVLVSWIAFFAAGVTAALLMGDTVLNSLQFGVSLFIWGVVVRTILVWHITWSVNAFPHVWGYRNYDTRDNSRNNIFVAIIACGEGWHNNHHANPTSASHGHRPWEIDVVYLFLRGLVAVGLAWNVVLPNRMIAVRKTHP